MIVGEVKEGPPRPNRAMRDPVVLEAALTRYAAKAGNGAAGANYDRRDRKGNRLMALSVCFGPGVTARSGPTF